MPQPVKRKKLYFDLLITRASNVSSFKTRAFNVTQFTVGTAGDRYGELLDALQALTAGSDGRRKAQNAVTSLLQCANLTGSPGDACVDIIPPSGNATLAVPIADAVLTRHFRVRIRTFTAANTAPWTLRGVLYVQRQHSIEV